MATRRLFSREFKLEAVKLVVERGVSVAQAAKDLDTHENVLRKWVREAKAPPVLAPAQTPDCTRGSGSILGGLLPIACV